MYEQSRAVNNGSGRDLMDLSARLQGFGMTRLRFNAVLVGNRGLLAAFSIGLFARLIPEMLAFPNPIGFDTITYAVIIKNGVIWPNWSTFFTSTWLFSGLSIPFYQLSNVNVFTLLNVLAPVLYGVSVAGVFWVSTKMLNWGTRLSLMASVFFAFQLAPLRISWDLLRNTLGMGLLLFTLPFVRQVGSRRGFAAFVLLSLLTVFAHEFAAVILLSIILVLVIRRFLGGREIGETKRLLFASFPAFGIFLVDAFFSMFPVGYATASSRVFGSGDSSLGGLGQVFFLVNYFDVRSGVDYYSSYGYLALNVIVLFAILYGSYLLLVWKGFFRNELLDTWTVLLLIGSFGCLVVPFFALELWCRWMFMLAYPFTFYAVNAISKFSAKHKDVEFPSAAGVFSRKVLVILLATIMLGTVYLATPVLMSTVNVGVFSIPLVYKYFSSSPTVPYQDVEGVVQAMEWLNSSMSNDSCVVLHQAFLSWGELYLDKSHTIVAFTNDFDAGLAVASEKDFVHVYSVWWNQNIGWYGLSIPGCFVRQRDFGRISVYEYTA